MNKRIIGIGFSMIALAGCTASGEMRVYRQSDAPAKLPARSLVVSDSIPADLVSRINEESDRFFADLKTVLDSDTNDLLVLADKSHELSSSYVPQDLVPLSGSGVKKSYLVSRDGFSLRAAAESALEQMSRAALNDGVTLVVSSSYRSYDYQKTVYERNVRELGQAAADRESARPGTSQHQLGTAMDLGSITDAFAETKAGRWMELHGGEWGWSLSFPDGYEKVTGYRWESWHWRYVGVPAAELQKEWFGDIQQYMLEFIDAWRRSEAAQSQE